YDPGDEGTVKLAWRLAQAPGNDAFAAAQTIGGAGGTVAGTNVGAGTEEDEPAHDGSTAEHSVWYRWTAPADGLASFDVIDADFDTNLAVYTGASVGALVEVSSNDDFGPLYLDSRVLFWAQQGVTYRIAVDGYDDTFGRQQGSFSFAVNRRDFSDVSRSHPFFFSIEWVSASGVANGYADGTYRPGASISRAAMSAFLYRLDGNLPDEFTPPGTPTFTDVSPSHPFYREIEWMADEGISTGYDDDTYRPSTSVSRGAMSAFIFRFEDPTFVPPVEATFPDVPLDHPFFDEVEWMVDEGITTG
ncbi:hypothetical protein B7486_63575, partial [cyanobacterium TDX16]